MSVLKIPALAITALDIYSAFTPPQPKPKESDSQKNMGTLEKTLSPIFRLYAASFKVDTSDMFYGALTSSNLNVVGLPLLGKHS